MAMDLQTVLRLIKVNGLTPQSPDPQVSTVLQASGYTPDEIPIALSLLHGNQLFTPAPAGVQSYRPQTIVETPIPSQFVSMVPQPFGTPFGSLHQKVKGPMEPMLLELILSLFIIFGLLVLVFGSNFFKGPAEYLKFSPLCYGVGNASQRAKCITDIDGTF